MKPWMRWLLFLPAAIGAYVAVSVLVGMLSEFYPWDRFSPEVRNFVSQLGNSIGPPIALIYAGSKVAPSHRFVVSVVLASIFGCMNVAVAALAIYAGVKTPLSEDYVLGTWWLLLSGAISLVAAGGTCVMVYHQEPQLGDDRRSKPEPGEPMRFHDTPIEEIWRTYKKTGCEDVRDSLIEHCLPLVKSTAERMHMRLPGEVDVEDLTSAGLFGLMDAIDDYDPEWGVAFEKYCTQRVRGAIFDELRATDWVARLIRARTAKID